VSANAANTEKLAAAQQSESKALRALISAQTALINSLRNDITALASKQDADVLDLNRKHDADAADLDKAEAAFVTADATLAKTIEVVTKMSGPQGERGEKGEKGDTGATGAAGQDGAKGEKGDTGEAGEAAKDDGPPCTSTYRLTAADLSVSAHAPYWNGDASGLLSGSQCCTLHFDQWAGNVEFRSHGQLLDVREFTMGEGGDINYVIEARASPTGQWEVQATGHGMSRTTWGFQGYKNAYRFRQTSGWYGGPWYANAQLMQCLK
jgi:hypothetical protein